VTVISDPPVAPAANRPAGPGPLPLVVGRTTPFHAKLTYQPSFDGIRGVGLFFVLASHNGFLWAKGGFFWVSSFFTLSAYLITSLLVIERNKTGMISMRGFWSRRFRRLMPGALLTLLIVAVFGFFVADATQLQRLRVDGLAALFYVANWNFVLGDRSYAEFFAGLSNPSPVQHFWTLSIEEQFYIFLPLLIVGCMALSRGNWRRVGIAVGAITVASIAWMQWIVNGAQEPSDVIDRMYFGTDTRLPELTLGVLLGIVLTHWRPDTHRWIRPMLAAAGPMALAVILYLTFTVERTDEWLYRGGFAVYAVLSCILVASAAQPFNLVKIVLSAKPVAWLGRLSYGTYLIHWPLFLWLDQRRLGIDGWALFAVRMSIAIPLAWASNKYFEHPIRVGKRITGWRTWVVTPAATIGVVAAILLVTVNPPKPGVNLEGPDQAAPPSIPGLVIDDVLPVGVVGGGASASTTGSVPGVVGATPSTNVILPFPGATTTAPPPTTATPPSTTPSQPPPRQVTGPVRILFVGDSQAFVIGNALTRWSERSGGAAAAWNQSVRGCGIVRGGEYEFLGKITTGGICEEWPTNWANALDTFKPHVVVVLTGGWDWHKRKLPTWADFKAFGDPVFDQHLVNEYGAAADVLASRNSIVAWLTTPCYALEGFGEDPRHLNNDLIPKMTASRKDRVVTLDLFGQLCPGGEYSDTLGGLEDARPDGSHLSDAAADWLVSTWLGPELVKLVKGR